MLLGLQDLFLMWAENIYYDSITDFQSKETAVRSVSKASYGAYLDIFLDHCFLFLSFEKKLKGKKNVFSKTGSVFPHFEITFVSRWKRWLPEERAFPHQRRSRASGGSRSRLPSRTEEHSAQSPSTPASCIPRRRSFWFQEPVPSSLSSCAELCHRTLPSEYCITSS